MYGVVRVLYDGVTDVLKDYAYVCAGAYTRDMRKATYAYAHYLIL